MGRRRKAKAAQALAEAAGPGPDRGALADCLTQTSKIAAECNSILRDLLRGRSPQHQDLQRLASQVLMGQTLNLQDLQKKMESQQATLAELLKLLKPSGGMPALAELGVDGASLGACQVAQPSLSIVKGWDYRDLAMPLRRRRGTASGTGGGGGGGGKPADRPGSSSGAAATKRDRCAGVEAYWRALRPEERRAILRVPIAKMVNVARAEGGEEGARELWEGLALLRQHGGRHACYWRCPCCDARELDARGFVQHLQLFHEEVQYAQEDVPLACSKCSQEVVGAYYLSEDPGYPPLLLCMRCCWDEQIGTNQDGDDPQPGSMQLCLPSTSSALAHASCWSDSTEPLSVEGSLGSSEEGDSADGEESTPHAAHAAEGGDSDGEGTFHDALDVPSRGGAGGGRLRGRGGDSWGRGLKGVQAMAGGGGVSAGAAAGGPGLLGGALGPPSPAEQAALEAQMQRGKDGLMAAIVARVKALAAPGGDRRALEAALAAVLAQAQRLLSAILWTEGPEAAGAVAADKARPRREAAARLSDPSAHPNQVEELQAALCALDGEELQQVLGYLITCYGYILSSAGAGGAPLREAGLAEHDLQSLSELEAFDPGCASLFAFSAVQPEGGKAAQQPAKHLLEGPTPHESLLDLVPAEALPSSGEVLEVSPWWLNHLVQKSWHDFGGEGESETYLLQWIFGNVAHAGTEDFAERQRLACGGGPRGQDNAVMLLYCEVADTWRHLAATMDRKRHLVGLKETMREEVATVRRYEEGSAVPALRAQANDFFSDVGADLLDGSALAAAGSDCAGRAQWSQRALGKLQRFHQLKDENSIRYAQALIDREIAILELAEVMGQHEAEVAEREQTACADSLAAARAEAGDAEAEAARAAAGGPAAHRKRDLLDKVNKEAEHRELVQALAVRGAGARERIAAEEVQDAAARARREAALAALAEVRSQLQVYYERRTALDHACHEVLAAQERDREQELTDAYVDARIRAVWQVVTSVADAIRSLHGRYAPEAASPQYQRLLRCTTLAKTLTEDLEGRVRAWWADLDKLRRRVLDLAAVDLGAAVEAAALEVVRQQLEEAAAAAREAATLDLLAELEQEEEAKRAAESKKLAKRTKSKSRKSSKGGAEDGEGDSSSFAAAAAEGGGKGEGEAEGSSTSDDEAAAAAATAAAAGGGAPEQQAELEYEAALERRRKELEAERQKQELELIKLVQEASLKEQTGTKASGKATPRGGKHSSAPPTPQAPPPRGAAPAAAAVKSPKAAKGSVLVPVPIKSAPTTPAKVKGLGEATTVSTSRGAKVIVIVPPPPPPPANGKAAAKAAAAAPGPPAAPAPAAASAPGVGKDEMRIISYFGDWICHCGKTNRLWDTCACSQIPPCRDWVRGRCTYKDRCRFKHPPFELPDNLPRPKSPIAKPGADAVVYAKGGGGRRGDGEGGRASLEGDSAPPRGSKGPKVVAVVAVDSKLVSSGSAASAASAEPPPPLKPAPWAGVRPGTAVAGAEPAAPAAEPAPMSLLQQSPDPSGFHLFGGGNPLLGALSPASQPMLGMAAQQPGGGLGAFGSLGGGPLGGMGRPLHPGAPLFQQQATPADLLAGFQRGQDSLQHSPMRGPAPGDGSDGGRYLHHHQQEHLSLNGTPSMQSPQQLRPADLGGLDYGGGGGGLMSGQPLSAGLPLGMHPLGMQLHGGMLGGGGFGSLPGASMLGGLGHQMGSLAPSSGGGGGDDWGDLQLQLPSDLGEMLGPEDYPVPAYQPYDSGNNQSHSSMGSGQGTWTF